MTDAEESDMYYYDSDEEESYLASTVKGRGNCERRAELERQHKLCSRCRPNGGENRGRQQRSDQHKSQRKGR